MSHDQNTLPIRSYRLCFELERRIHRIDRWRIPLPYGLPIRGIAYAALALVVVLAVGRLPLVGDLVALAHPAIRLVITPVGAAYLLTQLRVDGRPAHSAGVGWLRHRLSARRVRAFAPAEPSGPRLIADVAIAPDERTPRLRAGTVRGPASVLVRYPARARQRGATLELRQSGSDPLWRARRIELAAGQALRLR